MTEEETCFLKSYMLIHKTSDGMSLLLSFLLVCAPRENKLKYTCFMVYNRQGHSWAALRPAAPPTREELQASGNVVDAASEAVCVVFSFTLTRLLVAFKHEHAV